MDSNSFAGEPDDGPLGEPRVGVLVVAYNAETTIPTLLDRLPESFRQTVDHVLICDDASIDRTYELGCAYRARSELNITVVRNDRNLGYGGNQKLGYRWAIEHGLDVVVLLHGDGQYAPEVIESIVEPIIDGSADMVMGSRMMQSGGARSGGMPLYKFVGNKLLTRFQNATARMHLTEWHSGYRAYRTDALRDLALDTYSDGFNFDTQIILGMHGAGKRIVEVPIPTYYGDEICYVNGMAYAARVSRDVLRYRMRGLGLGSGLTEPSSVTDPYAFRASPHSSHRVLLTWLSNEAPGKVLDVGCSDGTFAAQVRALGHTLHDEDMIKHDGVADNIEEFIEADLNNSLPEGMSDTYDLIVAADVLEHVVEPHELLTQLADRLNSGGKIMVSIPNVGHRYRRGRIAAGTFDYDERGPLDHRHLRFFTRKSFAKLVADRGLDIAVHTTVGSPFGLVTPNSTAGGATRVVKVIGAADRAAVRVRPTLFGHQFLYQLVRP